MFYNTYTQEKLKDLQEECLQHNAKLIYKCDKNKVQFPAQLALDLIYKDRVIIEVHVYDVADLEKQKEDFNEEDLLYSTILFVIKFEGEYNKNLNLIEFGEAYVTGIQYDDKTGNKIEYLRVKHIDDNKFERIIKNIWKDKIYLDQVYRIIKKRERRELPEDWEPVF